MSKDEQHQSDPRSMWISESGEDIEFKLTSLDATLILDQIVIKVDEMTLATIMKHRKIELEEVNKEVQGYLDDASICFVAPRAHKDYLLDDELLSEFTKEQLQEYIDEAEHGDGYQYWYQFETPQELHDDIKLYFESM